MNDTLNYILAAANALRRGKFSLDPQHRLYESEYRQLHEQFRKSHSGDHSLIRAVNDLLDTQVACSEYESELMFLLGLQMGLELRDIRLVPKTEVGG